MGNGAFALNPAIYLKTLQDYKGLLGSRRLAQALQYKSMDAYSLKMLMAFFMGNI